MRHGTPRHGRLLPNGPWQASITVVSGLTTSAATASIQFAALVPGSRARGRHAATVITKRNWQLLIVMLMWCSLWRITGLVTGGVVPKQGSTPPDGAGGRRGDRQAQSSLPGTRLAGLPSA